MKIIPQLIMLLSCSLAFTVSAFAQLSEQTIWKNAENFIPSEQLYVHTVKDRYMVGDSISFAGYIKGGLGDTLTSRFVYFDLLNSSNEVVYHGKYKRGADGELIGKIPIGLHLTDGMYTICGYSSYMLNFDHSGLFYHPIIVGKEDYQVRYNDNKARLAGEALSTRLTGAGLEVVANNSGEAKFVAIYSAYELLSLQEISTGKSRYIIPRADLPLGEFYMSLLSDNADVIARSALNNHTSQMIDSLTTADKFYVSIANKSDLINIEGEMYSSSPYDIEKALRGEKQDMKSPIELSQTISGEVNAIGERKLKKGYSVAIFFDGNDDEFYTAQIDPQSKRFSAEIPEITGQRRVEAKLMEPKGSYAEGFTISFDTVAKPISQHPFVYAKLSPITDIKEASSIDYAINNRIKSNGMQIGIKQIDVQGSNGEYDAQKFKDPFMFKYNQISDIPVKVNKSLFNLNLYQILQSKYLLPFFYQRLDPRIRNIERAFKISAGLTITRYVGEESKTDGDWLWKYVIDDMECTPDDGMFTTLMGSDIRLVNIITQPHAYQLFGTYRVIIAIETYPKGSNPNNFDPKYINTYSGFSELVYTTDFTSDHNNLTKLKAIESDSADLALRISAIKSESIIYK